VLEVTIRDSKNGSKSSSLEVALSLGSIFIHLSNRKSFRKIFEESLLRSQHYNQSNQVPLNEIGTVVTQMFGNRGWVLRCSHMEQRSEIIAELRPRVLSSCCE
jgi:hypothetical protein